MAATQAFEPHRWAEGETITAERLNAIEAQLAVVSAAQAETAAALETVRKARTTRSRKTKAAE